MRLLEEAIVTRVASQRQSDSACPLSLKQVVESAVRSMPSPIRRRKFRTIKQSSQTDLQLMSALHLKVLLLVSDEDGARQDYLS